MQIGLKILGWLIGVGASWWIGKLIKVWLQAYADWKEHLLTEEIKIATEKMAQKAQSESDRLKEIEGR